jgi:hypothetical protein
LAEAGHIGVFMGKAVIQEIWTDQFKRLSTLELADTFDGDSHLPAQARAGAAHTA